MDLGNVKPLPWGLPCNGPSEILVPPSGSLGGQRLMIKHILIAVTTALLVLPNLSSIILADPPEVPDDRPHAGQPAPVEAVDQAGQFRRG